MRGRGCVWIAVAALVAGACAGSAEDEVSGITPGVSSTMGASGPGQRADCVGFYLGTFDGDDGGPFALSITDDGSLASAFVRPDSLDVDLSDVDSVAGIADDIGLVLGEDISIGLSGVEISPNAVKVDADGVRVGILEVRLASDGTVDDGGAIEGSDRVTGNFAWDTCTGSGEWTDGTSSGVWRVALAAAALTVDVEACDEGIFVGVRSDYGDLAVDFNAFCLSRSVRDLPVVSETDDVEIKGNDEVSVYTLNATVLFEFGSDALTADSTATLDEVAAAIIDEGVESPMITVIGHTDSIGSAEFNLDLSKRRAETVRSALADRLPGVTMEAFGLGETSPIAPNGSPDGTDNPEGRRRNRRVEIIVTG